MILHKKKEVCEAGYISFIEEFNYNNILFDKRYKGEPQSYLRKIDFNFSQSNKGDRYKYINDETIFNIDNFEIEVSCLEIGGVYTLQKAVYGSNRYDNLFTSIIIVTRINNNEIEYVEFANELSAKKYWKTSIKDSN